MVALGYIATYLSVVVLHKRNKHKVIGFFKFPENAAFFKSLKKTIGQYRTKGGADTFEIRKTLRICEFHFQAKEGGKTKMDIEEPAFKITSMLVACDECKKHKTNDY